MENVVNFAQVKRLATIALHGLESGLIAEMIEVCLPAGEEVVDGNHAPLLGQRSIAKMGSQEPAPPVTRAGCRLMLSLRLS